MRIPLDPIFDVALLLADIREHRKLQPQRLRGTRAIADQTGIPTSTVQYHMRPSNHPKNMTADHAMRWMLWLGRYDIREYQKEISGDEGEL